jgi:uncharacterized surface protein with fasciclin (FAS1) repeats
MHYYILTSFFSHRNMHIYYLIALVLLMSLEAVRAQESSSNNTILQMLNDTSNSPALKFVEFLHSSPEYQPIIDILSDPLSNVTLFVPSDQVYFDATGEQPPATNTSGSQNSSQPTDNTTQTAIGTTATAATAASSSVPIHETFVYVQIAPTPTKVLNMAKYVKVPNAETVHPYGHFAESNLETYDGPIMRALHGIKGKLQTRNYYAARGWNEVTTNAAFADQFSYTDILNYHLVNGSVQLENNTIVLNTFLTNNTVNKLGYGSPICIQKGQQAQQQPDQPQSSGPSPSEVQPSQTQPSTQTGWQTEPPGFFTETPEQPPFEPMETPEPQWLLKQQQQEDGGGSTEWTIGTGSKDDAQIMENQTLRASNGIIYIIDKSKMRNFFF